LLVDIFIIHFDLTVVFTLGISSFIRLMERRKVLFPQPDGPIMEVMAFSGISTFISLGLENRHKRD
jgi:hypothetical protein